MARKVGHDECVEIVNYFDKISKRMIRRVEKRQGSVSVGQQVKIVRWADEQVYVQYGLNIRDLFV